MAKSCWGTYSPHLGKHLRIPLDDYCVPDDASIVVCEMQKFTCKDMPVSIFHEESLLEKEDLVKEEEGEVIRLEHIVPFLKYLKLNKERYFPPEGSVKWNFCCYKKLRFSRVSKNNFIILGNFVFPLNWRTILEDTRYGTNGHQ